MFQRLLICTTLADGLQRLVHFVPQLAEGGIQHVTFLHVLPIDGREIPKIDEEKVQQVRESLAVAQSTTPEAIEVRVEVQTGRPVDRILATAQSDRSDLIVLGTESRSLLTEKLFGSTAIALCQSRKIPVLILRPQLISTYTVEELALRCRHLFRYFLIPYNGSRAAEHIVSQIKQSVSASSNHSLQECFLLWILEDNARIDKLLHESRLKEAETKLAAAKAELEQANLQVTAQIVAGEPVPETLRIAVDYDITAIALASDTLGRLMELSKPSFTGEMLRRSWHPVLFFPSP